MLPTKFRFIWLGSFRGEDFLDIVTDRDEMINLHRGHSIDASYQVSVHLAKRFRRRRFKKIGQLEPRIACGGNVCK